MNVLRVAQTVYPDVAGGGAYHVHALSRAQARRGHDVTVLTVRQQPDRPHVEQRAGYTLVRHEPTADVLGNALSAGLARHLHEADGYDVLHAHSHLYFSTNLAALERSLGDVPLAITNHGLYSQTVPEWLFDPYLRTVGRWTFNRADVVFCYTGVDEGRLRELGVESDVAVVPNGIDTERFTPEGPDSDLIDAEGPVVLFVGRLVDGKRPQDAVDAVERIRNDRPEVSLYVCGEGPLREELAARSDGALDGVEFLGQVPYDEMPRVYRSADALVLPSRAEGVPRTVLEAMASGTPVVTSDLPHVREVVEHGGFTAPQGDVEAFADRLLAVLDDPPAADAREYVRRNHRWQGSVEATTEALAQLRRGSS